MTVAEQVYFPIAEISTYQNKWTIKGRVTSKGPLRTFKKGTNDGKVYHVDLLDAEGGEIRASFFNDAATEWYDKMEVGKCFTMSKGTVKIANRQYNTCKHRYELTFDKMAQVEEVKDDAKIDNVKLHVESLRDVQQKTLPYSVDICGIVTAFDQPVEFRSQQGKDLVKRVITVADDSAVSMQVTLWGDRAKKEDALFEGNPVIAMKGVLVKEWQGGLSGSLLEGGTMIMQPTMEEAKKVKEWWSQGGQQQNLTFISQTTGGGGSRLSASAKTMDVSQMRHASEQVSGQEAYNIFCRLSTVQTRKQGETQQLVYMACMEMKEGTNLSCNRRVDENGVCAVHGAGGKVAPRLNLRCRFMDETDGFWVTTFHEAAQKAIGLTAEQVKQIEQDKGREAMEAELKAAYFGDLLQVTLRAKPDMYNGESRTNVTCVAAQPAPLGERGRSMLSEIRSMLAMKYD
eukprot:TRINITY_DN41578_c0_g1_i1.p1 TRINITY_DN41578_c0_g1~~TRINITY_DN41578_c0_g1_i1.p1  ORF type:complete len:457 (+),score=119.95 TRINITY_DN41578_c0_g1_i1:69-1439(+)